MVYDTKSMLFQFVHEVGFASTIDFIVNRSQKHKKERFSWQINSPLIVFWCLNTNGNKNSWDRKIPTEQETQMWKKMSFLVFHGHVIFIFMLYPIIVVLCEPGFKWVTAMKGSLVRVPI